MQFYEKKNIRHEPKTVYKALVKHFSHKNFKGPQTPHFADTDLTHSFFQGGWHFPENPKIDGDTDPFLKSGKILNHHAAPARICISKM